MIPMKRLHRNRKKDSKCWTQVLSKIIFTIFVLLIPVSLYVDDFDYVKNIVDDFDYDSSTVDGFDYDFEIVDDFDYDFCIVKILIMISIL